MTRAFDVSAHLDVMAARFYRETRFIAPCKDKPMGWHQDDDAARAAWAVFMREAADEAWLLWHERHGTLDEVTR